MINYSARVRIHAVIGGELRLLRSGPGLYGYEDLPNGKKK